MELEAARQRRGPGALNRPDHRVGHGRGEARHGARAQDARGQGIEAQRLHVPPGAAQQAVPDAGEDADGGAVGEGVGEVEAPARMRGQGALQHQPRHHRAVALVEREVRQQPRPQRTAPFQERPLAQAARADHVGPLRADGVHQERVGRAQRIREVEPAVLVPRVPTHVEVRLPQRDEVRLDGGGLGQAHLVPHGRHHLSGGAARGRAAACGSLLADGPRRACR